MIANYQNEEKLAVILMNAQRYILWVNNGLTNITGYSLADVQGQKLDVFTGKYSSERVIQKLRNQLDQGLAFEGEIRAYKKDGSSYVSQFVIHPIFNSKKEITNFIVFEINADESDATDYKEMQLNEDSVQQFGSLNKVGKASAEILFEMFKSYLEEKQCYLKTDLTIKAVADTLNTNRSYLSKAISKYGKTNFPRFVNGYRINCWLDKMKKEENRHYDFGGLAMDCGFRTKRTFFRTFKKLYGESPAQYLMRH